MRSGWRRASVGSIGTRSASSAGYPISQTIQAILVLVISSGLFWLIWIYGNGLRDARYLDGWMLTGGMSVQLWFHIAKKRANLSAKSVIRWRKIHIFNGYLLIAAFVSHSDFSLPDTTFEWALWTGFVLVSLSGIFGTYLTWSLQTKRRINESLGYDRIPALRAELARDVHALVAEANPASAADVLPVPPHDAWIADLYTHRLRDFFQGQRNVIAHLNGSQRPLRQLMEEIDSLSRYVDQRGQEKLAAIKDLVIEKDRLDFTQAYLGLNRAWLFIHVPVTYTLIVLIVVHVIVVYAYSAGLW